MRARRWSVDRRLADDRITMLIALGVGDVAAQHDLRRTAVRNFERAAVRSHQVMASARTPASPRARPGTRRIPIGGSAATARPSSRAELGLRCHLAGGSLRGSGVAK